MVSWETGGMKVSLTTPFVTVTVTAEAGEAAMATPLAKSATPLAPAMSSRRPFLIESPN
ncbi:hypothetical protein Hesp01_61760 [Herbidospora sp. NBRC 101105]|nr:hypothetical protein Hesp01_61760 [Herbidospora sp. NBRC 101105]